MLALPTWQVERWVSRLELDLRVNIVVRGEMGAWLRRKLRSGRWATVLFRNQEEKEGGVVSKDRKTRGEK